MTSRFVMRDTWLALLEWQQGSTDSERLACQLLPFDGFRALDPSHPLGGPDGLRDAVCLRDDQMWIVAVYFSRGQKTFTQIETKFQHDLGGINRNEAEGIVFFTNQELRLAERDQLINSTTHSVEIYHLERIASLLNQPRGYSIRQEFLGIMMSLEEHVSHSAIRDEILNGMNLRLNQIERSLSSIVARQNDGEEDAIYPSEIPEGQIGAELWSIYWLGHDLIYAANAIMLGNLPQYVHGIKCSLSHIRNCGRLKDIVSPNDSSITCENDLMYLINQATSLEDFGDRAIIQEFFQRAVNIKMRIADDLKNLPRI